MTNDAILAILALPDIPERQLRFLLALGTFTRGKGGWREAGIRLLASKARLSPTTAAKARAELLKAGAIEFVPGRARQLSIYRIRLPGITDHLDAESTNNAGTRPDTNNAGTRPDTNNAGTRPSTNPPAPEYQPGRFRVPGETLLPAETRQGTNTYGSQSLGPPRRTPRTGSRGEPAATDDDDDSSTQPADLDGGAEGAPAAVRDRLGPGYGLCPECRDWYVVSKGGGRLGRHDADLGGGWSWCPGSGREPVEPVPCAGDGCGRTGVALTGYAGLCRACRTKPGDEVPW